jgi:hypothetical protein
MVKFVHFHVGVSFRVARVLCDALFFSDNNTFS